VPDIHIGDCVIDLDEVIALHLHLHLHLLAQRPESNWSASLQVVRNGQVSVSAPVLKDRRKRSSGKADTKGTLTCELKWSTGQVTHTRTSLFCRSQCSA
jgi:hypothetical protein